MPAAILEPPTTRPIVAVLLAAARVATKEAACSATDVGAASIQSTTTDPPEMLWIRIESPLIPPKDSAMESTKLCSNSWRSDVPSSGISSTAIASVTLDAMSTVSDGVAASVALEEAAAKAAVTSVTAACCSSCV